MKYLSVSKLKRYEREFCQNKYDGKKREKPFKYVKGKTSVLVSACHTVNHSRNGNAKLADMLTGAFAKHLKKVTGCHIFYRLYNDGCDPNFDNEFKDGGYKKALAKVVKENNIKLVLDLHAAIEKREFDIDLGTDFDNSLNGYNFIPDIINIFAERLGINKVTHNKVFSAPPNTVTNYIANATQIPAIQLEINRRFRDYNDIKSINLLLNTLTESVHFFNQYDWSNKNVRIFKVERSKTHIPHDKIEFSTDDIYKLGINDNDKFTIQTISASNNKSLIAHFYKAKSNDNQVAGAVKLTNRFLLNLFDNQYLENINDYVLVNINTPLVANVGISKSAHDSIVAGKNLYKKIDSSKKHLLYNRAFNIEYLIDRIELIENTTAPNCLFLDRYQKQLFNISLPLKAVPIEIFEGFFKNNDLSNVEIEILNSTYIKHDGVYEIKKNEFGNNKLLNIQKKIGLDKLEVIETTLPNYQKSYFFRHLGKNIKNKILTRLIGSKNVLLRVGRAYPVDEQSDIVRLSPDIMKVLGVSEMDKVIVQYNDKAIQLRVLEASNYEINKIVNDYIYDETDDNILIGIPNKWRIHLGIFSINSIVNVKRDVNHITKKNTNRQLLPFIGIVFTILQTFNDNLIRLVLILFLFPTAVYINFSEERSKIK